MPKVYVTDRSGNQIPIEFRPGFSLMQSITDAAIGDLLALCGGVCSCATCHVYVHSEDAGRLPRMDVDEDDLLAMSGHRLEQSRLSCQVLMSEEFDGLRVTIAPED